MGHFERTHIIEAADRVDCARVVWPDLDRSDAAEDNIYRMRRIDSGYTAGFGLGLEE